MQEFQLIAIAILIFCSALLALSFLPAVKSKTQSISVSIPKKTKQPKRHQKTPAPSTDAQQIILDAINILHLKVANINQKINELMEDVAKL